MPCAWAAAIGDEFTAELIQMLLQDDGRTREDASSVLRPAVTAALVRSLDSSGAGHDAGAGRDVRSTYRFSHPRIRALLYASQPRDDKPARHAAITRALKRLRPRSETGVMQLADHLNAAVNFLEADGAQRADVAHHNLLAARAALGQGLFQAAYKYARTGLAVSREADAAVSLELSECAAEAAFLCGDFHQLYRVIRETHAQSSVIEEVRVRAAAVQNRLQ